MVNTVVPADKPQEDTEVAGRIAARAPSSASLRRRILSGTFWSLVGRAGSTGCLFATNVLLGRSLSVGEFSAYAVAAAAVILLGMPAAFGVPKVLLRSIREGLHADSREALQASWASAWRLMAVSCTVVAAIFLIGVHVCLGDAIKWTAVRDYSLLTVAWMCLSALLFAIGHALQGFDDFRSSVLVGARNGGVIPNAVTLAAMLVLWPLGRLNLATALAIQVAASAITLVFALRLLRQAMQRVGRLEISVTQTHALSAAAASVDGVNLRWYFRESWPNLVVQITSLGLVQTELLIVSLLTGEHEIAAYAAVLRLMEVLTGGQALATSIVAPFIAELYVKQDLRKLEMVVRGAASMVAIPTLFFLVIFLAFPTQALTYTFGPDFALGAAALRIISIGASISSFAGVNGLTMIMVGRQRELLRALVVAFGFYLAPAPLLIHYFSIIGAATTITLVFGTYNIIVTLMVKKEIGVWTTPAFSPSQVTAAVRMLRR